MLGPLYEKWESPLLVEAPAGGSDMIGGVAVGMGVVLLETTMAISAPVTRDERDRYLEKSPAELDR